MRRARYLAGDDASSEAESALERMWPRDPDADMCPARQAGSSTDDCMDHQAQRSAIGQSLSLRCASAYNQPRETTMTINPRKQESKQAGGVCGGAPDYDGKIKEAAHKRAKPLAGLAFRRAVEEGGEPL
jgi:hypothetical protein